MSDIDLGVCSVCQLPLKDGSYHEKDGTRTCIACVLANKHSADLLHALVDDVAVKKAEHGAQVVPPPVEDETLENVSRRLALFASQYAECVLARALGIARELDPGDVNACTVRYALLQEVVMAQRIAAAADMLADKVIAR